MGLLAKEAKSMQRINTFSYVIGLFNLALSAYWIWTVFVR